MSLRRVPAGLLRPRTGSRPGALRPRLRLGAAVVLLAALATAGWLAFRDCGLVAVTEVEVSGVSGPQRGAISAALETAGRDMTTLHVRPEVLRTAVAPFAVVQSVSADGDPPHRLRIRVSQRVAVATVGTARGAVPVAADGTVLEGSTAGHVPELRLALPPAGRRITDPRTRATLDLVASAPAPLRARIAAASGGAAGLTVALSDGPVVHFGSSARLAAKWASLTAVLASPASAGATAIDVRIPERPAAAGLEQASTQRGQPSSGG